MSPFEPRSRLLAVAFAVMAFGVAFHALHAVSGFWGPSLDDLVDEWVYTAVELVAVGVCAARVLRRGEDRAAWLLITVGLLTWTGGDLLWTVWLDNVANPPYPSIADAFYLTMYPTVYVALLLLMRSHFNHVGVAAWLDGIVVGLAIAAISAGLIFPAVLGASRGGTTAYRCQPRLPARRLLAARVHRRRLRAVRLAARTPVAAAGARDRRHRRVRT